MKRFAIGLAGLLLGLTGLVGVAHTQVGRPLLAYMPWGAAMQKAACPLGYDAPRTAAERAEAQQRYSSSRRGTVPAASRPALGFALDATTRADLESWALQHGVTCRRPQAGHDFECEKVPAGLFVKDGQGADVKTLWFDFDERDRLISIIVLRRDRDAEAITTAFQATRGNLTRTAGPPTAAHGEGTTAELRAGLLRQASVEYRFSNYYAVARATHMSDGFLLTEEYRSIN